MKTLHVLEVDGSKIIVSETRENESFLLVAHFTDRGLLDDQRVWSFLVGIANNLEGPSVLYRLVGGQTPYACEDVTYFVQTRTDAKQNVTT